jgi:hypothetical protein
MAWIEAALHSQLPSLRVARPKSEGVELRHALQTFHITLYHVHRDRRKIAICIRRADQSSLMLAKLGSFVIGIERQMSLPLLHRRFASLSLLKLLIQETHMIRALALATLAAGFAFPVMAAETDVSEAGAAAINATLLAQTASQHEAFQHLARQGYVNIALTEKDDDGRWVGTAYKDGRTVIVAVESRRPQATDATN